MRSAMRLRIDVCGTRRPAPADCAQPVARARSARRPLLLRDVLEHVVDRDASARAACRELRPRAARAPASSRRTAGLLRPPDSAAACADSAAVVASSIAGLRARLACAGARPCAAACACCARLECGRAARPARSRPAPASGFPRSTPPAGAGISIVTLSVSSSISGSFSTTASPTDFSQRWTCERVPSVCSLGARISMVAVMLVLFFRRWQWCGSPARCARRSARLRRAAADCAGSARPAS